ncbi:MAG: hypothetical protein IJ205_07610, partial [Bacteroidales bacterium]|nr:hypothetical protein [Bacteroidales bacterium]
HMPRSGFGAHDSPSDRPPGNVIVLLFGRINFEYNTILSEQEKHEIMLRESCVELLEQKKCKIML